MACYAIISNAPEKLKLSPRLQPATLNPKPTTIKSQLATQTAHNPKPTTRNLSP
jgi:hypothetical protein